MEGLKFVRSEHLFARKGMYLPPADIPAKLHNALQQKIAARPNLKKYIPDLRSTDFLLLREPNGQGDIFLLLVSPTMLAHLPTWDVDDLNIPDVANFLCLQDGELAKEVTDVAAVMLTELGFEGGFAVCGRYPHGNEPVQQVLGNRAIAACAEGVIQWAISRAEIVEASKVFLSHRGIEKPLVRSVDRTLRMLNLKTWLDEDDILVGAPLVRAVNAAFESCSAAVFFISKDFMDVGVIGVEIERAIHHRAMSKTPFSIIPLVLRQHGGTDDLVPQPLRDLKWVQVDDVDIVPVILTGLPEFVQNEVRFLRPK